MSVVVHVKPRGGNQIVNLTLPEGFRDLSYTELGTAAFSGKIPGVSVRQSNQA
jgi:hypothetical protein